MMRRKSAFMPLLILVCFGPSIRLAMAEMSVSVSPTPVYSGDTVTVHLTPPVATSWVYIGWARFDANVGVGLIDTDEAVTVQLNGLIGNTPGFIPLLTPTIDYPYSGTGYGDTLISDYYGDKMASVISTVSGDISFVAGLPGVYSFEYTWTVSGYNETTFDDQLWYQPSSLSPQTASTTITVLEGSRPTGEPIPAPAAAFLGLLGLATAGVKMRRRS